jgi:hypothetical protein
MTKDAFITRLTAKLDPPKRKPKKTLDFSPGEIPPRPGSFLFTCLSDEAQTRAERWWEPKDDRS